MSSICRPTPQTSTLSRRPGPNSNNCSATAKQEPHWRWNKPSLNSSPASALKTLKRGSDSPSTLYSKAKYALVAPALMSGDDNRALKEWFSSYLTWLKMSQKGKKERDALNNHATCWA